MKSLGRINRRHSTINKVKMPIIILALGGSASPFIKVGRMNAMSQMDL